jgi:hypothetical protein
MCKINTSIKHPFSFLLRITATRATVRKRRKTKLRERAVRLREKEVSGFDQSTPTKLNHKQTRPFNNQKHNSNITTTQSEQPQHRSKTNLNQIYKPKLLYKQTTAKPTSFATSNHQEKHLVPRWMIGGHRTRGSEAHNGRR